MNTQNFAELVQVTLTRKAAKMMADACRLSIREIGVTIEVLERPEYEGKIPHTIVYLRDEAVKLGTLAGNFDHSARHVNPTSRFELTRGQFLMLADSLNQLRTEGHSGAPDLPRNLLDYLDQMKVARAGVAA